jgi:alpha-L-rhamnosidase
VKEAVMPILTHLRAEHVADGVVGVDAPRLSWQVGTDHPSWVQSAYQVRVRRGGVWQEADRVESADQVLVGWPLAPLASREVVDTAVRVWGPGGGHRGGAARPRGLGRAPRAPAPARRRRV